jgi:hypothetical protein
MEKKYIQDPGSVMNITDLIFENLVSVFGLKILKFFDADIFPTLDPGWKKSVPKSGTEKNRIRNTVNGCRKMAAGG